MAERRGVALVAALWTFLGADVAHGQNARDRPDPPLDAPAQEQTVERNRIIRI